MVAHNILVAVARAFVLLGLLFAASAASAGPSVVRVSAFITSISGIDLRDGSFRIVADLWFTDLAGGFDPIRDVRVLARQSTLTLQDKAVLADGATLFSVKLDATVDQAYNVQNYPFSRQVLAIALEAQRRVEDTVFVADNAGSGISDVVNLPDWDIEDLRLDVAQQSYASRFANDPRPFDVSRLALEVQVEPRISSLIFERFTGFVVAMFITTFVFAVPVKELGSRVGMTTSSVFAAVINRYRLGDSVGFQSSYGLADQISLITFSAILTALMLSLVTFSLQSDRSPDQIRVIDRRAGTVAMVLYWALWLSAFAFALKDPSR